ncbi:hypothetical protein KC337_g18 [Hortaea werneckii]|nr:hypothetical protein KC337_g18 [Hortaea werneckii]
MVPSTRGRHGRNSLSMRALPAMTCKPHRVNLLNGSTSFTRFSPLLFNRLFPSTLQHVNKPRIQHHTTNHPKAEPPTASGGGLLRGNRPRPPPHPEPLRPHNQHAEPVLHPC